MNNYKLLRPLLSLLQTRNLTESAHELNVTQSAMSRTLTKIREAFDDPILIRDGKHFILSQRGEELLLALPNTLESLDSFYIKKQFNPSESSRQFKVAYTSFLSSSISAMVCGRLSEVSPNVSVDSCLWQTGSLAGDDMQKVDLVATLADQIPESIYGKKLFNDSYVVVMARGNPLADGKLTLKRYGNAKHVLVNSITDIKLQVDEVLFESGIERKILTQEASFFSAMKVIVSTEAVMTLPRHILNEYGHFFELAEQPLPFSLDTHDYYLLWHAKYQNDPEHRWFREFCFPLIQNYLQEVK
ncbi:LysR substrate-binding domain-containing protein [Shewanella gelidimarina]|uniref:LysR family transcriptional regulator n=1 Tax=Shewanella gelidimarina TaxID=56813 RepID=UPI00200F3BDC|nr:LysR family transcriptional regulator [Shewanella gelidimarina]MCL1060393.1 LysR substrate-binding domain-containing protein [Shewanella gelidimarina]